jgi:hypothetical protein
MIIRYVDDSWAIRQQLIDVRHLNRSPTSDVIGVLISDILTDPEVGYGVSLKRVIGAIRDSASVNGASLEKLATLMPNTQDVHCVSHALNRTGKQWNMTDLDAFMAPWNTLFAHSGNVRLSTGR